MFMEMFMSMECFVLDVPKQPTVYKMLYLLTVQTNKKKDQNTDKNIQSKDTQVTKAPIKQTVLLIAKTTFNTNHDGRGGGEEFELATLTHYVRAPFL